MINAYCNMTMQSTMNIVYLILVKYDFEVVLFRMNQAEMGKTVLWLKIEGPARTHSVLGEAN